MHADKYKYKIDFFILQLMERQRVLYKMTTSMVTGVSVEMTSLMKTSLMQ